MMGEFRVHHVRFYEFEAKAIHCIAYEALTERIALSRSDGSIEIWSIPDNWYQEKTIPGSEDRSVEALIWCEKRLFSSGLDGDVTEYDLCKLQAKTATSANAGAVWCLTKNASGTRLASGCEAGCVVLLDVEDNALTYHRSLDKQEGRILSVAWHASEDVIVTGGIDNIRLWSVSSGHALQRLTLGRQDRNKETIVWSIAITSDMTVISGDSRGKTSFWNGKQGTLIKSYQSHKADVLCLSINESEDCVFSSGIDPVLAEFKFIARQPDSDWKMWVRSSVRNQHTHDVRAVTFAGKYIVTGGVDTNLIFNLTQEKKSTSVKSWRRMSPCPHRQLVHTARAAGCILLHYPRHLELWKLGSTNRTSEKSGEILALRSNPIKLLQLVAKAGESIVCCAISSKARWIAYSDQDAVRLYKFSIEQDQPINPKVHLQKVKLHDYIGVCPAHHMMFSEGETMLVTATCDADIQAIDLTSTEPLILHTFTSNKDVPDSIHLLSLSSDGRHIATANSSHLVNIYSVETKQQVCCLPKYAHQATALTFNPHAAEIIVAYSDQMIFEYSIASHEYTPWCRENNKKFHPQWLKRFSKITHLAFNPRNANQIFIQDEQMFCILDKSQPFPALDAKFYTRGSWLRGTDDKQREAPHAFHICTRYKYLIHLDVLSADWLVAVERPPMTITEALPPTLHQKKFGT